MRNTCSGSTGWGRPGFGQAEQDRGRDRQPAEAENIRRAPGVLAAAPGGQQDDGGRGHREQGRAQVVDLVLDLVPGYVQGRRQVDQRGPADRHVDVENPAPGQVVGDVAADRRVGDLATIIAAIM